MADLSSELVGERSDEERHSERRKCSRPVEAWNELQRRITNFGMLLDDGTTALGVGKAAGALVAQWTSIFDSAERIAELVAERFLAH